MDVEIHGEAPFWVVFPSGAVPRVWASRVIRFAIVPLLPDEAKRFRSGSAVFPGISRDEESVAHLHARGMSAPQIAKRLHVTTRTVYRRLEKLRKALNVATPGELATALAHHGFGQESASPETIS
jgi:DNA-binding NarL/FixJ family response regulator